MSNFTTKLGLKKPLPTDLYNIEDFNTNADIIDEHLYSLQLPTSIDSGIDLNTMMTPGVYRVDSSVIGSLVNCPIDTGNALLVVRRIFDVTTGYIQELHCRGTGDTLYKKFSRSYLNGNFAWGDWKCDDDMGVSPSLHRLHITKQSCTTAELELLLPRNRAVAFEHSNGQSIKLTDAPSTNGVVTAWKHSGNKMVAFFHSTDGKVYYWRNRPNADVQNTGWVEFNSGGGGTTHVSATVEE